MQDIEKKFILDSFDKTQNPTEWFSQFESEWARHKVTTEMQMIEVFRFFVTGSAKHWYNSNLKKLGLTGALPFLLSQLESECARHKVTTEMQMIEVLRFFVTGSAKHWYNFNLKKLGLTKWPDWRTSFFTIFIDKGWTAVRKAYSYRLPN